MADAPISEAHVLVLLLGSTCWLR